MESSHEYTLITGAAGFIGSALAKRLLEKGKKIVGIDNLNSYYNVDLKKDRLIEIGNGDYPSNSDWIFIEKDISDIEIKKFLEI